MLRAVQVVSLIACVLSAHASAATDEPGSGPPSTAPAAKPAAPSTGPPASTAPPSTAPGAPATGKSRAPAGPPAATAPGAGKTDCDRYVTALQGRGDPSLFDKPEVRALATSASDLVMCRAVLSDSEAICSRLMGEDRGPSMACRETMYVFRDLRSHPDTHAFMFTEARVQECNKVSWVDAKVCEALRAALLANDAKKCAPERQTMCRAYVELDPSLCQVPDGAEQQFRDAIKKAGPAVYEKQKGEPPLTEKCKQEIESKKFLARGLKELAESGPARERALARAALGQADACEPFAAAALKVCRNSVPPSTPGGAPAAEKSPSTPGAAPAEKPPSKPGAEKPKP